MAGKPSGENSRGVRGGAERFDAFGSAQASADFDRDGHADLAVGVPYESLGAVVHTGAVNVLYGSPRGLTHRRNQFFAQSSRHVPDADERGDQSEQGSPPATSTATATGIWRSARRRSR